MKFKLLLPLCLIGLIVSCKGPTLVEQETPTSVIVDTDKQLSTIAFGSCSHEYEAQPMWQYISQNAPELWIWLGDIIYGDSDDVNVLRDKYAQQKANSAYSTFIQNTPVIGIWDDHDYGTNDGDKHFPIKAESKDLLMDFLVVPADASVRKREGAYNAYTFGQGEQQIKVILLDGRYFRDTLARNPAGGGQRYFKNETGDMLGDAQWAWLEKELTNSQAQIHIIGCGIQVLAEEHFFEKWANFPLARKRFLELLQQTKPNNPILISGDRHIAEISKIELEGLDGPLYDITSSGMTHSFERIVEIGEPNQHREGDKLTGEKNFGLLLIDWEANPIQIRAEIRGLDNKLLLETKIR